jgi:hypothetical protein
MSMLGRLHACFVLLVTDLSAKRPIKVTGSCRDAIHCLMAERCLRISRHPPCLKGFGLSVATVLEVYDGYSAT